MTAEPIRELFCLAALLVVTAAGCSAESAGPKQGGAAADSRQHPSAHTAPTILRETWDAYFVRGARVGHRRTVEAEIVENGQVLRRIEAVDSLRFKRFGQLAEQTLTATSIETPPGHLLRFHYTADMGQASRRVDGRVQKNILQLRLTAAGRTTELKKRWADSHRGFFGVEQCLRNQPMKPAEQRELSALLPLVDDIARIELVAGSWETTHLLSESARLLRVESTMQLPADVVLRFTLFMDEQGEILKTVNEALEQVMYRTTKQAAMSTEQPVDLDLGLDLIVKPDRPLDGVHAMVEVEYEAILDGQDPSKVFLHCPSQSVRAVAPHRARIIVRAVRPGKGSPLPATGTRPTEGDMQPNSMIESDDPQIIQMALGVAADERRPWEVAVALEQYVHRIVTKSDFSQVFATAAEVASHRQGDCTEHAVLLAALCRARQIPARVAVGLVYAESHGGFLYHMWNEVWIEDRWVPLDATRAQAGIGAGHLKVADANLHGTSAYSSLLPVLQLAGRLKIKVIKSRESRVKSRESRVQSEEKKTPTRVGGGSPALRLVSAAVHWGS